MSGDHVRWIGDRDDCWLVRLRSETPLWWIGDRVDTDRALWVGFPNACRWADPLDAQLALHDHIGCRWQDHAMIQSAADSADEWALWFSEVWSIACAGSQLDEADALEADPVELVDRFLAGVMAGIDVDPRAMTTSAAQAAQRWAAWSLERRERILADVIG